MVNDISRYIWMGLGCLALALGTIGIVLPFLPTVPFYLLTLFCFSKSSPKLHRWFVNTELYKKYLASYSRGQGMTMKAKLGIIIPVTIMMTIGFYFMHVFAARVVMCIVWVAHIWYFIFKVKTIKEK